MNRPLPYGWDRPWNNYLRKLSQSYFTDLDSPRVEGNILVTPDGFRWRIEGDTRIGDVVYVGDHIKSYYGSGTVINVVRHDDCCCPFKTFHEKICQGRNPRHDLHVPVVWWNIQYSPDYKQKVNFKDCCNILEVVYFDGQIMELFENALHTGYVVDRLGKLDIQLRIWDMVR